MRSSEKWKQIQEFHEKFKYVRSAEEFTEMYEYAKIFDNDKFSSDLAYAVVTEIIRNKHGDYKSSYGDYKSIYNQVIKFHAKYHNVKDPAIEMIRGLRQFSGYFKIALVLAVVEEVERKFIRRVEIDR